MNSKIPPIIECPEIAPARQLSLERPLVLRLMTDQSAWYEFFRQSQPFIAAVIIKTLRRWIVNPSPSVVDDLVQETYLKLCADNYRALRKFVCRHEHAGTGFLKVVASNVAQDYLRNRLARKHGCGKGEEDLDTALVKVDCMANAVTAMERAVAVREVEDCLEAQYSEPNFHRDRRIFRLYYRHGFTAQAISRQPGIGLGVKGVESALFRVTELLRAKLNRPCRREGPRARRAAGNLHG